MGLAFMDRNFGVNATGKWSVGNPGSGNFVAQTLNTTVVNNLAYGENIFWWLVNADLGGGLTCQSLDSVIIHNNKPQVDPGAAGPDKEVCGYTTLNAQDPPVGLTGYWVLGSGSAAFDDINDPKTGVTLGNNENTLEWTIRTYTAGSGLVCESSDEVIVTNNNPGVAAAGDDFTACDPPIILNGNII